MDGNRVPISLRINLLNKSEDVIKLNSREAAREPVISVSGETSYNRLISVCAQIASTNWVDTGRRVVDA